MYIIIIAVIFGLLFYSWSIIKLINIGQYTSVTGFNWVATIAIINIIVLIALIWNYYKLKNIPGPPGQKGLPGQSGDPGKHFYTVLTN